MLLSKHEGKKIKEKLIILFLKKCINFVDLIDARIFYFNFMLQQKNE